MQDLVRNRHGVVVRDDGHALVVRLLNRGNAPKAHVLVARGGLRRADHPCSDVTGVSGLYRKYAEMESGASVKRRDAKVPEKPVLHAGAEYGVEQWEAATVLFNGKWLRAAVQRNRNPTGVGEGYVAWWGKSVSEHADAEVLVGNAEECIRCERPTQVADVAWHGRSHQVYGGGESVCASCVQQTTRGEECVVCGAEAGRTEETVEERVETTEEYNGTGTVRTTKTVRTTTTTRTTRTRTDQRPPQGQGIVPATCSGCGTAVCAECMATRYPYWLWHEVLPRAGGDTVRAYLCGRCEDRGGMHYVAVPERKGSSFVEILKKRNEKPHTSPI